MVPGNRQLIPIGKSQRMCAVELAIDEVPPVETFKSHRQGPKLNTHYCPAGVVPNIRVRRRTS